MRLPSHLRARREPQLRAAGCTRGRLARGAAARSRLADAATSGKGERGVFVSKGVGRQIFTGGGGVAYGVVFSGGSLVVADYSADARHAASTRLSLPTTNADGSRTYVPAGGAKRVAFRISGTLYRVTVTGVQHVQRGRRLRSPAGARQGHGERQRRALALERARSSNLGQGAEGRQEALPARA